MNGNVYEAMQIMQQNMYTNVPILQNKKVIGVFDENSLFVYLAKEGIAMIDNTTTFMDIREYLSINNREMEDFLFVNPNLYVDELEDKMKKLFSHNRRIGMAFVTTNGKSDTDLTGIITPWDIIANH